MKTTLYTVLCVAIRLGAVLMAVGVFERLPGVFFYSGDWHYPLLALLMETFTLLLAFVLWMRPSLLAWWALGGKQQEILESPIHADQLHYVAFSVLGAWLAISGVAGCFGHGTMILLLLHQASYDGAGETVPVAEWHWMVQYGVMVVAGILLMLGSRGLIALFQRLRGYPHYMVAKTDTDADTPQDS
ncbi:hypothetical protein IMW82_17660 [Rhodanobacter sp. B2A1Ga4]|uniref:hypothetical protein n=1 Tax=Rhodanobacter TaxID=75309 RepID=UPI000D3D82EF|nr:MULTISPECIES: hypothetical protein [Rhodanobacter]MBQ4856498.1 hypothetical protein [Rhodanobacter sp. B2A1Ga4]